MFIPSVFHDADFLNRPCRTHAYRVCWARAPPDKGMFSAVQFVIMKLNLMQNDWDLVVFARKKKNEVGMLTIYCKYVIDNVAWFIVYTS